MSESPPKKPNVEYENPLDQPSAEDMASRPFSRAILGKQGPGGFMLVIAAIILFIIVGGTLFYIIA